MKEKGAFISVICQEGMAMSDYLFATADDCRQCLAHRPTFVETSVGVIEYADRGEGPVLLSAHGSPGGYDQGLAMVEVFRKNGYRIISPSRPGYLALMPVLGNQSRLRGMHWPPCSRHLRLIQWSPWGHQVADLLPISLLSVIQTRSVPDRDRFGEPQVRYC